MKTPAMIKHESEAITRKIISMCLGLLLLTLLFACASDDEPGADAEDSETAQLDAIEDYYAEDAEDLAIEILANQDQYSGGRTAGADDRLTCAIVTFTGNTESGSITVDFGEGCTDARGRTRRGLIVLEFEGRWNVPGSFWRLHFENYSINAVQIEGIRLVTNVSETEDGPQAFTVDLEDGTMTWPDGSVARRTVHRRRELERDENNVLNRLIIYGTAEGNHRNGRGYLIEILEPLVYDRSCVAEGVIIPVSGVKLIKHGERQITVNYGDGSCDNTVTITNKNGRSWNFTVGQ